MTHENTTPASGHMFLTFLAGAALGALVVALTTPKTGPELRGDLKDLSRRAKRKADDLTEGVASAWNGMKERSSSAAADLNRGVAEAANDLKT